MSDELIQELLETTDLDMSGAKERARCLKAVEDLTAYGDPTGDKYEQGYHDAVLSALNRIRNLEKQE